MRQKIGKFYLMQIIFHSLMAGVVLPYAYVYEPLFPYRKSYMLFGIINLLVMLIIQLFILYLYLKPVDITHTKQPLQAEIIIKRLEFLPYFMAIIMTGAHIVGFLISAMNLIIQGMDLSSNAFGLGFGIFIMFAFVEVLLLFLIAYIFSFKLIRDNFLPEGMKSNYAQERFKTGINTLAVFWGNALPIFAYLISVNYYYFISDKGGLTADAPFRSFAYISLSFVVVAVILLGLYFDYVINLNRERPSEIKYIPEFYITKYQITQREKDILELIMQGFATPKIAEKLFISQYTVKNHLSNIYRKFGTHSRNELLYMIFSEESE